MGLTDDFYTQIGDKLLGKSIDCPSRWAEKRRIMGQPFPGPYNFRITPWTRELHDSKAVWNVSRKSAQAGFTEVGIDLALYNVDVLKQAVLYVLPTLGDSSDFSKTRFNPALRLSPYLKNVFTSANNDRLKMAGNVPLYIRGSRGDSGLKSIPTSVLILDEMDEMDKSQIELAFQRLKGQPDKIVWMISTPTFPNHGVSVEFALSTQEVFRFKCAGCNKIDEFTFPESIEICGESINDPDVYRSYHKCKMCGYKYKTEKKSEYDQELEVEKLDTLYNTGFWDPTVLAVDPDRRGFAINQLYSYTVPAAEIVIDYFKSLLNPYANQEFHKSVLGEPFQEESSQVTNKILAEVTGDYSCQAQSVTASENRMITLGIDRGKLCNYVVCEWFVKGNPIDLNESAMCRVLDAGIYSEDDFVMRSVQLMTQWAVRGCVIDADPGMTEGKKFARKVPGYVWLCRYRDGRVGKQMTVDDDGSYAPVATVDRTSWLDMSLGRFHSRRIELPFDLPVQFGEHIKNLVRKYELDKNGNPFAVYTNLGPDHYGHALNYAEMALPFAASIAYNCDVNKFL